MYWLNYLYPENRSKIILQTKFGESSLVDVQFQDNFTDSFGDAWVCVVYSVLNERYHHSNFYSGYWKKEYIVFVLGW